MICTGCSGSGAGAGGAGAGAPPPCSSARRRKAATAPGGEPIWIVPPDSVEMGGMGICAAQTVHGISVLSPLDLVLLDR